MSTLISVIIPVYNCEKYLARCIDSVISQTYTALEIILCNDGSPDNCPIICDEYAKKDNRIKVIHKPNGGASSARNAGLDIATGEFVCFVDSDDFLPEDSISNLYAAMTEANSQYVSGAWTCNKTNNIQNKQNKLKTIELSKQPAEFLDHLCSNESYSPFAKMYRLDIFNENKIRYDEELKCSEDALLIRQYFKHCSRVCITSDVVYYYNYGNENSLSKKGYPEFTSYFIKKLVALDELTDILPITKEEKLQFLNQRAVHGLKISIYHFLAHWKDAKKQKVLIKNAINLLEPWLFLYPLGNRFYLNKWWEHNKKYLAEDNFEIFFKKQKRMHTARALAHRVLRKVKSAIKRL